MGEATWCGWCGEDCHVPNLPGLGPDTLHALGAPAANSLLETGLNRAQLDALVEHASKAGRSPAYHSLEQLDEALGRAIGVVASSKFAASRSGMDAVASIVQTAIVADLDDVWTLDSPELDQYTVAAAVGSWLAALDPQVREDAYAVVMATSVETCRAYERRYFWVEANTSAKSLPLALLIQSSEAGSALAWAERLGYARGKRLSHRKDVWKLERFDAIRLGRILVQAGPGAQATALSLAPSWTESLPALLNFAVDAQAPVARRRGSTRLPAPQPKTTRKLLR